MIRVPHVVACPIASVLSSILAGKSVQSYEKQYFLLFLSILVVFPKSLYACMYLCMYLFMYVFLFLAKKLKRCSEKTIILNVQNLQ